MQKLFNVLAAVAFGATSVIIGAATFLYANREQVINNVKDGMIEEIQEQLPYIIDEALNLDNPVPAEVPSQGGLPSGLPL